MPIARPIDIDCYTVLEILQTADTDAIKRAYRRLSLLRHPDKNPGNPGAHDAFCILNTAFDILSDPNRRILYDADYLNFKYERETEAREHVKQERDAAEAERLRKEQEQWQITEKKRADELLREQKEMKRIQEDILKVQKGLQQAKETTQRLNAERKASQGWWDYLTDWNRSAEAREADKRNKELDLLQSLASQRIKLASLTRDKEGLELQERAQKEIMLTTDKRFQLRKEKVQKYRREQPEREAAVRRKAEQERLAREEAEQKEWREAQVRQSEAIRKEERERARARETAANAARENLEKARQKAAQEHRRREEEELKKSQERFAECERRRAREAAEKVAKPKTGNKSSKHSSNEMAEKPDRHKQRNKPCKHPGFWPKVSGQNRCEFCSEMFYQFILRCPECQCMACASCRRDLKTGSR